MSDEIKLYHELKMSISHSRWFSKQRDLADFLNLKSADKKSIEARCRVFGYEICWDDKY